MRVKGVIIISAEKARDLKSEFFDIGFKNKIKQLESRVISSAKCGKESLEVVVSDIYFSGDSRQNNNIIQKLRSFGYVVTAIGKDNKEYAWWQEDTTKVVVYW